MNVSKIVSTVVNTVKRNPGLAFAAGGTLGLAFTAGFIFGNNINKVENEQKPEVAQTPKQNKSQAKPKEPVFEYVAPKIGEEGIIKADTFYFAGTKKPEAILYTAEKNKPVQETRFNKDGSLKTFTKFDRKPIDGAHLGYSVYNNKGEEIEYSNFEKDGSSVYASKDDRGWNYYNYDKKDKLVKTERSDGTEAEHGYKPNGNETILYSKYGIAENFYEYDKNGKEVSKKDFDENGVVKYTVNTKYDKDGCVVKKDTIWNK